MERSTVGVLNLDKPRGITSAAAVGRLRRSSGIKRVGHGGTLDPQAAGVLPIFFGRATVLAQMLSRQGKSYIAGIRLGAGSDTDDAEGNIEVVPVPDRVDEDAVGAALEKFVGEIEQSPPAYSALKVDGQRSYRVARGGAGPDRLPARPVTAESLRLADLEPAAEGQPGPLATVEIECGPGFYVRALARDLGEELGTRAHLESLVRTGVGSLRIDDAVVLDDAEALGADLASVMRAPAIALTGWTVVAADATSVELLRHGRDIPAPLAEDGAAYATDGAGRVLAVGRVMLKRFRPRRLVELE